MTSKILPPELIKKLLEEDVPTPKYIPTPQRGPLRFVDKELRCASKGCGSSTYIKIDGIPYCMMHSLKELNEIAIRLTDRIELKMNPGDLFE